MNTSEAKFILQARRPDGRDDQDPRFSGAMEQARRDPALTDWLTREQSFDSAVSAKLRAVQPPADLRAAILAGARASRPTPFWRRPGALAMAASVALAAGMALAWFSTRPVAAGGSELLALGVMDEVGSAAHHDAMPSPRGELRRILSSPDARLAGGVPLDFDQLKRDGCRSLRIAGREVLEVCFERGADYHLYVARRDDFKTETEPMFRERGTTASVSWADARHSYVLVSGDGAAALRSIL